MPGLKLPVVAGMIYEVARRKRRNRRLAKSGNGMVRPCSCPTDRHGLKSWLEAAKKRLHHNVLAIALANKLARIAWSVLARGRSFEARKIDEAAAQPA
jgi:hypothetical protein